MVSWDHFTEGASWGKIAAMLQVRRYPLSSQALAPVEGYKAESSVYSTKWLFS